jgi:hypothetical protein
MPEPTSEPTGEQGGDSESAPSWTVGTAPENGVSPSSSEFINAFGSPVGAEYGSSYANFSFSAGLEFYMKLGIKIDVTFPYAVDVVIGIPLVPIPARTEITVGNSWAYLWGNETKTVTGNVTETFGPHTITINGSETVSIGTLKTETIGTPNNALASNAPAANAAVAAGGAATAVFAAAAEANQAAQVAGLGLAGENITNYGFKNELLYGQVVSYLAYPPQEYVLNNPITAIGNSIRNRQNDIALHQNHQALIGNYNEQILSHSGAHGTHATYAGGYLLVVNAANAAALVAAQQTAYDDIAAAQLVQYNAQLAAYEQWEIAYGAWEITQIGPPPIEPPYPGDAPPVAAVATLTDTTGAAVMNFLSGWKIVTEISKTEYITGASSLYVTGDYTINSDQMTINGVLSLGMPPTTVAGAPVATVPNLADALSALAGVTTAAEKSYANVQLATAAANAASHLPH